MIFTLGLPVASVADVRYRWVAAGVLGAEQSDNVSQVGTFSLFRIDTDPPAGAEELIVYDTNDLTNYTVAHYDARLAYLDVAVSSRASALSAGSGAFAVTVTVKDIGGNPLENASVRMTEGINSFSAKTGADGVATFNLDAATYAVVITKPGYSFGGDVAVVTAEGNFDFAIDQIVIQASADPDQSVGYITTRDGQGEAVSGVAVTFELTAAPDPDSYRIDPFDVRSDSAGLLQVPLLKDARYRCRRGSNRPWKAFTVPEEDTFLLPAILGAP